MARIETELTRRFDLHIPVVAASMAGVSDGAFAAAASRAGILGTIGVGGTASGDFVRTEMQVAAAGGLPFGVGLMAWALPTRPEQLDAVLAAPPALVSVSFGDYPPYLERLRAAGCALVTQVGSLEQALQAQDAGVDFIVSRGSEGGGHGYPQVSTLPLLQAVLERVSVPVLAAGGIGTARGLAAVLAAGAAGAWVGSAFVSCRESAWPDDQVAQLARADERSTAYGHVFDVASAVGWPEDIGGRTLRNDFFDRWNGHETELRSDPEALTAFRSAPDSRDFSTMPVYIGQGVGLLDGTRPRVADVVAELAGAAGLLRAGTDLVTGG
ncbi:MAG: nitronate monooxygenase [Nocardioidaceae bacterium]